MKTVLQILESKGYDLSEQNEIVCTGYLNNESLDQKVRNEFSITEPIDLWGQYHRGESDEETMNEIAQQKGCKDYRELLVKMDSKLIMLAEMFPAKENK